MIKDIIANDNSYFFIYNIYNSTTTLLVIYCQIIVFYKIYMYIIFLI